MGDLAKKHNAGLLSMPLQSDCTIVSSLREYRLHRKIVCRHSHYFANQFSDGLTKIVTGVIKMTDDDPIALHAMIEWMYVYDYVSLYPRAPTDREQVEVTGHFDRDFLESDHEENKPRTMSGYNNDPRAYAPWLGKHVDVWNLGVKYNIPGLCYDAYDKFETSFNAQTTVTPETVDAIWKVYAASADPERDLRNTVLSFFLRNLELIDHPNLADVMTTTGLGQSLFRYILGAHIQPSALEDAGNGLIMDMSDELSE